jgi:hypothetical protein
MTYRGQGFLGLAPRPSSQQVVSLSQSSCVSPVELTDGRGGGGAKSYDRETWPSMNHSILSGRNESYLTWICWSIWDGLTPTWMWWGTCPGSYPTWMWWGTCPGSYPTWMWWGTCPGKLHVAPSHRLGQACSSRQSYKEHVILILNGNVVKGTVPRDLRCSINYKPCPLFQTGGLSHCFPLSSSKSITVSSLLLFFLLRLFALTIFHNSVNAIVPAWV